MKSPILVRILALTLLWTAGAVAQEDLTTWNKRMPMTLSGYTPPAIAETLTNFPVLVVLSNTPAGAGFNYNDFLSPPYGDLRFATASNGTGPLNYEVETWNPAGQSYVWVQVPAVTDATTRIWAFWGQVAATPVFATNGATWSNAYLGVWHMATNTSAMTDSSPTRRGSSVSGTIAAVPGMAGNACDFTPTAYIEAANTFTTLSGAYTVSAWINMDSNTSNHMAIVGTRSAATAGFALALTNAARILAFTGTLWRTSGYSLSAGVWKHLAYTRNDTNGVFYVDGAPVATLTNARACNAGTTLRIGTGGSAYNIPFDGRIDEVRVSSVDRSSNWMSAAYQNLANGEFVAYGAPDNGGRPVVSNGNVIAGVTSATVNGYLSSTGLASDTRVFLFWGATDGGASVTGWQNSVEFPASTPVGPLTTNIPIIALNPYFYRFYATNTWGDTWANPASNFTPQLLSVTKTWVGSSDSNWFNANNWNPVGVPDNGDSVLIDSSSSYNLFLTNSTKTLGQFVISNRTLIFTNWDTTITATNVLVRNGAIITLPAAYTNNQMSNRVHFACTNFLLDLGASIDGAGKGYAGSTSGKGNGPGGGDGGTYGGAAGHGGAGGDRYTGDGGGVEYGTPSMPLGPGSGGSGASAQSGGGAVWIEAPGGAVTIHGFINVDASNRTGAANNGGGGSGGSIYIQCRTFAGSSNGLLAARGARGNGSSNNGVGGGGAGGRIAVQYDPAAQALMPIPGMRFSVDYGLRQNPAYSSSEDGEMGTIYLPDARLLANAPSNFLAGRLFGVTEWSPSALYLANANFGFGETGFSLSVAGDIVCDTGAGLAMPELSRLNCGGDFVLTNGGSLTVYGGITNADTAPHGALISVTGRFSAASGSWIYSYPAYPTNVSGRRPAITNLAAALPLFRMEQLLIAAGGGFISDDVGFDGGVANAAPGFGPGRGLSTSYYGGGAGHGGGGGKGSGGSGGPVYGETNRPIQPGSGGGGQGGGPGGGGFRLEVAQTAAIDGTLSANGREGRSYGGGGSGGSIFMLCDRLDLGAGAVIRANGGRPGTATAQTGGGGGGGRIAIAIGLEALARQNLIDGVDVPGLWTFTNHAPLSASVTVDRGLLRVSPGTSGTNGTQVFLTTNLTLGVFGSPTLVGSPYPQAYGRQAQYVNWVTNTVTTPTDRVLGVGWACIGWSLAVNEGLVFDSGSGTQAVVHLTNHLDLTWYWTNEYQLVVLTSAETDGSVNSAAVDGWYTNGTQVADILATPSNGYAFAQWVGAVDAGTEYNNPLTVTMTNAKTLTAIFNLSSGGTKTWNGTGAWEESGNWTPAGMPGSSDDVIVQSGTVLLSAARAVNTVIVSNGATLMFTNWIAQLTASNVTVQSGGQITVAGPFNNSQMSNRVQVVCTNFLLETNGVVDLAGRGFAGGSVSTSGSGPGGANNAVATAYAGGGGHGGGGGDGSHAPGGIEYGSTNAPDYPGSGGAGTGAGAGGGAIRISAANEVAIHGTINADGNNSTTYGGGGSGGSIWIECATFAGSTNGLLTANGGNGQVLNGVGGGGAGGRIALNYGSALPRPGVRISVAGGTRGGADVIAEDGEAGSFYAPDTTFLSETMDNLLNVRFYSEETEWSADYLALTNRVVWFASTGFTLEVSGNIVCATNADLGISPHSRLLCGGNLVLTEGGTLTAFGGVTNEASPDYGSLIGVTNTLSIGAGSWIYPHATYAPNPPNMPPPITNLAVAVPLFQVGQLEVAAGGGFNANNLGFSGSPAVGNGYGPGRGLGGTYGGGGGYGGAGGNGGSGNGGSAYGRTNAPVQPGSGAGGSAGGAGGGGIRIEVAGVASIGGSLTANGKNGISYGGGGSGGGIFLKCAELNATASAVLSAEGRHAGQATAQTPGGGGGGRIAVWVGAFPDTVQNDLMEDGTNGTVSIASTYPRYHGTVSATNGINATYPVRDGVMGTVVFISVRRAQGTIFLIQ